MDLTFFKYFKRKQNTKKIPHLAEKTLTILSMLRNGFHFHLLRKYIFFRPVHVNLSEFCPFLIKIKTVPDLDKVGFSKYYGQNRNKSFIKHSGKTYFIKVYSDLLKDNYYRGFSHQNIMIWHFPVKMYTTLHSGHNVWSGSKNVVSFGLKKMLYSHETKSKFIW